MQNFSYTTRANCLSLSLSLLKLNRMNSARDPHINIRKILNTQPLSFYDHLTLIAMQHDFFFIIVAQRAVILNL